MEIKDRIIDKAGELFFQYGIRNISMDELASSLGISKRTIYEIFKDKEEILHSILVKQKEERNEYFKEFLTDEYNVVEVFIKIIELNKKMPFSNMRFFQDIENYYPKISKMLKEEVQKNNILLQEFLHNGIEQGYIRDNLNVEVAAFLVEESTQIYIRVSYIEKPRFSFAELFDTMMINFVRGISTEKGIKIIDSYLEKKESITKV